VAPTRASERLRRERALVLSPHAFLWYPADAADIEVRFRLPAGFAASTPWQPIGGGARSSACSELGLKGLNDKDFRLVGGAADHQ
jgi:hypothetical protein